MKNSNKYSQVILLKKYCTLFIVIPFLSGFAKMLPSLAQQGLQGTPHRFHCRPAGRNHLPFHATLNHIVRPLQQVPNPILRPSHPKDFPNILAPFRYSRPLRAGMKNRPSFRHSANRMQKPSRCYGRQNRPKKNQNGRHILEVKEDYTIAYRIYMKI